MSSDPFALRLLADFAGFEAIALEAQGFDNLGNAINPPPTPASDAAATAAAISGAATPPPAQLAAAANESSFANQNLLHRSSEPNAAQQYAAFATEADGGMNGVTPEPQNDELADALALELLLAQNGSLFNGAAGGVGGTGADANTRAAISALRNRKQRVERGHERVGGIADVTTDLGLSEHDFDDDASFDEEMGYINQAQSSLYEAVEERYSSFSDRKGGLIS